MKQITLPSYLIYTLIIGLLLIVVIFVFAMKDGNQCLSNPLVYGANKASTPETGGVMCSCNFANPNYKTLYFDKNRMSVDTLYGNFESDLLNLED